MTVVAGAGLLTVVAGTSSLHEKEANYVLILQLLLLTFDEILRRKQHNQKNVQPFAIFQRHNLFKLSQI